MGARLHAQHLLTDGLTTPAVQGGLAAAAEAITDSEWTLLSGDLQLNYEQSDEQLMLSLEASLKVGVAL
jgi:hypothetical protein